MLNKYLTKIKLNLGEYHIYLKKIKYLKKVLYFFKTNIYNQFKLLIDMCGIDYLKNKKERFEINYNLLSIKYMLRIHLKINIKKDIFVPSIINIYKNAN